MSAVVAVKQGPLSGPELLLPPGYGDTAIFALDALAEPPAQVVDFLARQAARAGLGDALDVFDLACGTGRRLDVMQERGWRVRASEVDRRLRTAARGRFGPDLHIDGTGPLDLDIRRAFDLVLVWDGALAYLPSVGQRMTALRRGLRALRPGGLLVLELPNLLWSLSRGLPSSVDTVTPVSGHRVRRERQDEVDLDAAVLTRHDRYRVEDGTGAVDQLEIIHHMSIITPQELAHGLRQAGFSSVETWTAPDAEQPGPADGPRLIVVARR